MKKIYLQPQMGSIKLTAVWALCGASDDKTVSRDDEFPFAPQRQAPAF